MVGSVITNFQDKKIPKEKAACKCLSIIMLDFVIKAKETCYPQTFFRRMQIWIEIDKNGEPYWWWFWNKWMWWVW